MEDVLEEPAEVDMALWFQAKESRELVRQSRDEWVSGIGPEHEQVVVREANGGRSCVHVVVRDSRVRHPCFTGVLEVLLEGAPFVPLEETVAGKEEEDADDDEDEADLGDLEYIVSEIVDDGGIHVVAE